MNDAQVHTAGLLSRLTGFGRTVSPPSSAKGE